MPFIFAKQSAVEQFILYCSSERNRMATLPAFNPATPFLAEIPGGLCTGQSIMIRGQILGNEMFNINLQAGAAVNPRDDTPLHVSFRLGDKKIVRNSFVDGAWQQEERDGKCPFSVGDHFQLQIKAKEAHYTLKINGKKFCKFKHRLPVDLVRFIHLGEGAVIESITIGQD